jgi:PAS domain S-box-containing protein
MSAEKANTTFDILTGWAVLTGCAVLLAAGPTISLGLLYLILHMIPLIVILAWRGLASALVATAITLAASFLVWGVSSPVDWLVVMLPGVVSLIVMHLLMRPRQDHAGFGVALSGLTAWVFVSAPLSYLILLVFGVGFEGRLISVAYLLVSSALSVVIAALIGFLGALLSARSNTLGRRFSISTRLSLSQMIEAGFVGIVAIPLMWAAWISADSYVDDTLQEINQLAEIEVERLQNQLGSRLDDHGQLIDLWETANSAQRQPSETEPTGMPRDARIVIDAAAQNELFERLGADADGLMLFRQGKLIMTSEPFFEQADSLARVHGLADPGKVIVGDLGLPASPDAQALIFDRSANEHFAIVFRTRSDLWLYLTQFHAVPNSAPLQGEAMSTGAAGDDHHTIEAEDYLEGMRSLRDSPDSFFGIPEDLDIYRDRRYNKLNSFRAGRVVFEIRGRLAANFGIEVTTIPLRFLVLKFWDSFQPRLLSLSENYLVGMLILWAMTLLISRLSAFLVAPVNQLRDEITDFGRTGKTPDAPDAGNARPLALEINLLRQQFHDMRDRIVSGNRKLRGLNESYESLLESVPIGVMTVDASLKPMFRNSILKNWDKNEGLVSSPVLEEIRKRGTFKADTNRFNLGAPGDVENDLMVAVADRVNEHAEKDGYWILLTDTSELSRARRGLERLEQRWSLALQGANHGVWDWNLENKHVYRSPTWLSLLGYEPEQLESTQSAWEALIHPDDVELQRAALEVHLSGEAEAYTCVYRLRQANGHFKWVVDLGRITETAPDGRAMRITGTTTDVSERVKMERELADALNATEAANKAKSQFLAIMSHEIRTPLNAITGLGRLLAESELDDQQRQYVDTFNRASRTLLDLITDLLDLSRLEAGTMGISSAPFHLGELLDDLLKMLSIKAREKNIGLELNADSSCRQMVSGDPTALRQILFNLIDNAIKFTATGSINVSVDRHDDQFTFRVTDTGQGIPRHLQSSIFEAFTQADPSKTRSARGAGLGLAISRELSQLMNGSLELETSSDQGSVFRLVIPLREPTDAAAPRSSERHADQISQPDPTLATAKVLLAEDSLPNQMVIQGYLESTGLELHCVEDGDAAVKIIQQQHFDAVLMDIRMPRMDGLTATKLIREHEQREGASRVPIIALTANAYQHDIDASLGAGCDEHLAKPVTKEKLLETLATAIRGRTFTESPSE